MNLQSLFNTPVLEQSQFSAAYEGHGSGLYRVRTEAETVVVRLAREQVDGPFWQGAAHLFSLDISEVFRLEALNAALDELTAIRVPRGLRKSIFDGRAALVMELLPGERLDTFRGQSAAMLEAFGAEMARLHSARFDYWGTFEGKIRHPAVIFHRNLAMTLRLLAHTFFVDDAAIMALLPDMTALALRLPPPENLTFIHLDIDPTQFLTDGERVTALVDTEAVVLGPRELDFLALEYVFGAAEAAAFAKGYAGVLPLPDLSAVRPLYRYLQRLMEVQGDDPIDEWMNQPEVFTP